MPSSVTWPISAWENSKYIGQKKCENSYFPCQKNCSQVLLASFWKKSRCLLPALVLDKDLLGGSNGSSTAAFVDLYCCKQRSRVCPPQQIGICLRHKGLVAYTLVGSYTQLQSSNRSRYGYPDCTDAKVALTLEPVAVGISNQNWDHFEIHAL